MLPEDFGEKPTPKDMAAPQPGSPWLFPAARGSFRGSFSHLPLLCLLTSFSASSAACSKISGYIAYTAA